MDLKQGEGSFPKSIHFFNPINQLKKSEAQMDLNPKFILIILAISLNIFFINKPLHIDDGLFVSIGNHIATHDIHEWYNFFGSNEKGLIFQTFFNPPLVCYIIAIASKIINNEFFYHLIFMIPCIFLITGIHKLAELLGSDSFYAGCFAIATPVYMCCAPAIMSDVIMTCFFTWSIIFWIEGEKKNNLRFFLFSSICISLSFLSKYFGITAAPLLFVFSILKNKTVHPKLLFLLIPIAVAIFFEIFTMKLYGQGLLHRALLRPAHDDALDPRRIIIGLSFFGGCFIWWITQLRLIPILLAAVFVFLVNLNQLVWVPLNVFSKLQLILMASIGLSGFICLGKYLFQNKDPNKKHYYWLTGLWIAGTFIFSSFINWTVNARTMLPMIAPLSILFSDIIRSKTSLNQQRFLFVFFFMFSLIIGMSDEELARSQKEAADTIMKVLPPENSYFEGGWGWSYYMTSIHGVKRLNYQNPPILTTKNYLIIPENNSNILWPTNPQDYHIICLKKNLTIPIALMSRQKSAGFHGSWGLLPFSFGLPPPEKYYVFNYAKK